MCKGTRDTWPKRVIGRGWCLAFEGGVMLRMTGVKEAHSTGRSMKALTASLGQMRLELCRQRERQ